MSELEIAKEIRRQIYVTDPAALMAWGARDFSALGAEPLTDTRFQLGGLRFKVNGAKHRGLVYVRLMACDTYTVEIYSPRSKKLVDSVKEIYCDELMSTIDHMIER